MKTPLYFYHSGNGIRRREKRRGSDRSVMDSGSVSGLPDHTFTMLKERMIPI